MLRRLRIVILPRRPRSSRSGNVLASETVSSIEPDIGMTGGIEYGPIDGESASRAYNDDGVRLFVPTTLAANYRLIVRIAIDGNRALLLANYAIALAPVEFVAEIIIGGQIHQGRAHEIAP